MTTAEAAQVPRAEFWRKTLRGWSVAFAVGLALAGTTLAAQSSGATLARGLALLAGLGVAYVLLALRAARTGSARYAHAYLLVLCLVTTAATLNAQGSVVLLFVAYSQIWFFGPSRTASVAWTLVMTLGVFGTFAWFADFSRAGVHDALVQGGFAAGFAILLGLWVTYIAEQSEVRAELVTELQTTRDALARSSHAAGVTAERERMAREIHDTLAQGFTSIVVLAQGARASLDRGETGRAAEQLALVERTARDNLAEARALVAAFAPVDLDGSSLAEALERLCTRFAAETGLGVEVDLDGAGPLSREREVVVLRVAQEALTNVRRHAEASHVRLRLVTSADGVALEVADDGKGVPPAQVEGFGLRGMRERVAATGGTIAVDSPPTGGTLVRMHLPTPGAS